MVSQRMRGILFSLFFRPFFHFLMMVARARRPVNWNNGRLWSTDLIKIDFPAVFNQVYLQAWIFYLNFSNCGSQSLLVSFWR